ncbi:MAG: shikimate kinase [Chlamydiota bacterium]|nr:shikimate kinase [Chlamydiota bacterium]
MKGVLCGMTGAGKSTLGEGMAKALNLPFFDTDRLIERQVASTTGKEMQCAAIFRQFGEEHFRKMERETLFSLQDVERAIIAVGGGALLDGESIALMERQGRIFYLYQELSILQDRLSMREALPLVLDPRDPMRSFQLLYEERDAFYRSLPAVEIVDLQNMTVEKSIDLLLQHWKREYGQ